MSSQTNMTKTEFLEAFKTCNKYLKFNYIEQDQFFNNMVFLMGLANLDMTEGEIFDIEEFDDAAYRKLVVRIVKMLGPEQWKDFENSSEQLRAEANSHFFAAGTDLAGIAIGACVGKVASKVTKGISRPYAKHLVKKVTPKGTKIDVNVKRLAGTRSVTTELNASLRLKTHDSIWGLEMLPWKKATLKDTVIEATINPSEVFMGEIAGGVTDYAQDKIAPGETFSFSFGDSLVAKAGNVLTDFIPYVGNAKAFVSSVTNFFIGREYSATADRVAEIERKSMEATRRFFDTYFYVDIEKDINSIDKKTLFKMAVFASDNLVQR